MSLQGLFFFFLSKYKNTKEHWNTNTEYPRTLGVSNSNGDNPIPIISEVLTRQRKGIFLLYTCVHMYVKWVYSYRAIGKPICNWNCVSNGSNNLISYFTKATCVRQSRPCALIRALGTVATCDAAVGGRRAEGASTDLLSVCLLCALR